MPLISLITVYKIISKNKNIFSSFIFELFQTGMHTNLDDTSEMFLTPEGGDPDVIVFEEKLERLKKGKSDSELSGVIHGKLTIQC